MNELELEIQANSPYNDGWTKEYYREQLEKKKQKQMNNYTEFVKQTTSAPSLDYAVMATRFAELEANGTIPLNF